MTRNFRNKRTEKGVFNAIDGGGQWRWDRRVGKQRRLVGFTLQNQTVLSSY
jgi:hypothetical protein